MILIVYEMTKILNHLDLQGLAINNLMKWVKLEYCTPRNVKVPKAKLVGETLEGEIVETECIEYQRIVRTWIVIKHYEEWKKHMVIDLPEHMIKKDEVEESN